MALWYGQMLRRSAFGQGMCQKVRIVARGSSPAQHFGNEREVIVLDEHDRIVAVRFGDDRVGEALVDFLILEPVGTAEDRMRMGQVAQRPQRFVREAVVVALFLFLGQPDAAQQVRRLGRPDRHAPVPIGRRTIRRSTAVRDPDAGARPHHRLERRDQSARRMAGDDFVAGPFVNERLSIRHDDHAFALQLCTQHVAKPLRSPRPRGDELIGFDRVE